MRRSAKGPNRMARTTSAANRFSVEDRSFVQALTGEDDLGCVVRLTIHIESLLISSIEQVVPLPKEIEKLNLDYHGRVSLAVALGMPPEIAPSLRSLGKLRNRFAHRLDMRLSAADVANLYGELPPAHREYLGVFLQQMRQEGLIQVDRYSALTPRNQLTLIAISLRRFLLGGLDQQRSLLKQRSRTKTS